MKCSICGKDISPLLHPATGEVVWDQGNNAEPINDGRCCDVCMGWLFCQDVSRWSWIEADGPKQTLRRRYYGRI